MKKHMDYRQAVREFKRSGFRNIGTTEQGWHSYIENLLKQNSISSKQYLKWFKLNPLWKREVGPELGPMRKQLTITVKGGLASGKTTIAFEITKLLLGMGFKVRHEDPDYRVDDAFLEHQELRLQMLKAGGLIATVRTEQEPRIVNTTTGRIRSDVPNVANKPRVK